MIKANAVAAGKDGKTVHNADLMNEFQAGLMAMFGGKPAVAASSQPSAEQIQQKQEREAA